MVKHINFYENLKEAEMRLLNSVVMYDNDPYFVIAISDHKEDGVFRIYLDKLGNPNGLAIERLTDIPYMHDPNRGKLLDDYLEKHPDCGIIRKMMNSKLFNQFRPFPLGMSNFRTRTYYIERAPSRHTQQGLTRSMILCHLVSLSGDVDGLRQSGPSLTSMSTYNTIKGIYPSAEDCIKNLLDPLVANTAVGFHRDFAFVRGPVRSLFLAYKHDVIGHLVDNDLSCIRIDEKFKHTKEVVSNLGIFKDIRIK